MLLVRLLSDRSARRTVRAHVAAAAAAAVRPPEDDQYRHGGPDAIRVLILGGGVAVGHGAATRATALDGFLGARLAAATGRGVVVQNVGSHDSRLAQQVELARSDAAARSADLVIWCPGYVEMTESTPSRSWGRLLQRLLRSTTADALVVLELPVPTGADAAAIAAAPLIRRMNERVRRAAGRLDAVHVVSPPPVPVRPIGEPLFGPDYYDSLAAMVARAVPAAVQTPARAAAEIR